jgi:ABC-type transporter Mla MlaB component
MMAGQDECPLDTSATREREGNAGLPALPAVLGLREASATAAWLAALIREGIERIDASQVRQIDTAGLQLLLAARQSLSARARVLDLDAPSAALRETACRLGVHEALGLQEQTR